VVLLPQEFMSRHGSSAVVACIHRPPTSFKGLGPVACCCAQEPLTFPLPSRDNPIGRQVERFDARKAAHSWLCRVHMTLPCI
jgi:hypothetical protein